MPITLLFTLVVAAPTCGPLDAAGALAVALAQADEVAIRKADVLAARADAALARAARFFPVATATALTGLVPEARGTVIAPLTSDRSLAGLGPFMRIDVDIVQPLFTWGRLNAARDAAAAGVKARERLVEDKVAELGVRVTQLFWGETLARRLLGLAADVEGNLAKVEAKLGELLEEGDESVKPADRYRLEVYKAGLRKRKAEARRGLDLAHAGLAATMALPAAEVSLREVPIPSEPGELPEVARELERAERLRPDVAALDLAITARENEVRAAEGAMKPQLFLGGNFSFAYAPNRTPQFNPWVSDAFNHVGGGMALGLRQDLAFPMLVANAEKARAQGEALRRQRDGLSHLVAQQVEAAVAEVEAARERLLAVTSAAGSGKAWLRSAGLDFEAGVGEPKDLLEAYAAYVELQVDQQQAAYDLVVARAKLEQAGGVVPPVGRNPCPPAGDAARP